jgi:hypothetical protein
LNALEESRKNDIGDILEEMGLESGLAVLVSAKIVKQPVHRIGKGLVLRVRIELLADVLELVGNAISVSTVAATKEIVALVVDTVPLLVGGILQNVSLLLENLADVRIKVLEPMRSSNDVPFAKRSIKVYDSQLSSVVRMDLMNIP